MAKRYDPILCMLVDKPDKAQDEILFYQLRFSSGRTEGAKLDESEIRSYAEALLEKYGEKQVAVSRQGKIVATYFNRKARDELKIVKEDGLWCVYKDGKQVGQSNSEAGAIRIYNRLESGKDSKARDVATATQRYINTIRTESKSAAENFVRQAEQDEDVPENELKYVYKAYNDKFGYKFHDSASTLDEAIKTCDGMFQQIFGKYSSAAKQHYDRAVKELDSFKGEIKDYLTLAGKWEMQIRNDLTRIDEAYNTAGNDYYAARREIQETMDSLTQVMLRKAREKRK